MHFDLRDEAGQSLPLLTSREQSRIMQAMLLQLAADTARTDDLPIETDDALAGALVELATRTYVDAIPIVRAVLNPQSEEWRQLPANRRVRHALRRDPAFADFLSLVAGHSVAIAPLVGPPGKRRVIKLTFEEPIAPDPSGALKFKQWIGNATGFRAQVIRLRAPLIGGAETHHYQVAIPRDVSITGAAVVAKSPRVVVADSVFDEPDHRPPNYDDGQSYDQQETGPLARADLRLERCLRPATGGLWVWLRADARGWLVGAIVASVFVAVALVTAVFMDDTLVNQAGPATSILLVVPGLTAVYMSRPGEHPLATRLLRFSRIVLALSGLCSFLAAAALLLLGPTPMEVGGREGLGRLLPGWLDGHGRELESPPELFWTLFGLAFVATVAALLLIAAYRWPRAERLR
jgi:hypothetical protein